MAVQDISPNPYSGMASCEAGPYNGMSSGNETRTGSSLYGNDGSWNRSDQSNPLNKNLSSSQFKAFGS